MDFMALALVLAAISLGLGGVYMAMATWMPEVAQKAKQNIPTIIGGVVLVGVAGTIISALS